MRGRHERRRDLLALQIGRIGDALDGQGLGLGDIADDIDRLDRQILRGGSGQRRGSDKADIDRPRRNRREPAPCQFAVVVAEYLDEIDVLPRCLRPPSRLPP